MQDIQVVQPWSVILFVVVFSHYYFDVAKDNYQLFPISEGFIVLVSIVFIALYSLTYFSVIAGNVNKSLLGTGGIGLNNLSTNESGFLSASLAISCYLILSNKKKNRVLFAVLVGLLASITILTESRISILILVMFFVFSTFISEIKFKIKFISLLLLILIAFLGFDTIATRFQVDYSTSNNYLIPELPISGSGRTLIWYYFLDDFFSNDFFTQLVGVGDINIIRIYDSSPLKSLGMVAASTNSFLPLHSELIDILISSGFLGVSSLFILFYLLYNKIKNSSTTKNAVVLIVLFIIFISFDMVVYNILAFYIFFLNLSYLNRQNQFMDQGALKNEFYVER